MLNTIKAIVHTILIKSGVRTVDHSIKYNRKEVPKSHGFRKFFTTQLVNSKVNPEIREMLLGHKIGLASCYYKPTISKEERRKRYGESMLKDLMLLQNATHQNLKHVRPYTIDFVIERNKKRGRI